MLGEAPTDSEAVGVGERLGDAPKESDGVGEGVFEGVFELLALELGLGPTKTAEMATELATVRFARPVTFSAGTPVSAAQLLSRPLMPAASVSGLPSLLATADATLAADAPGVIGTCTVMAVKATGRKQLPGFVAAPAGGGAHVNGAAGCSRRRRRAALTASVLATGKKPSVVELAP